jgi:hypothetical protein
VARAGEQRERGGSPARRAGRATAGWRKCCAEASRRLGTQVGGARAEGAGGAVDGARASGSAGAGAGPGGASKRGGARDEPGGGNRQCRAARLEHGYREPARVRQMRAQATAQTCEPKSGVQAPGGGAVIGRHG